MPPRHPVAPAWEEKGLPQGRTLEGGSDITSATTSAGLLELRRAIDRFGHRYAVFQGVTAHAVDDQSPGRLGLASLASPTIRTLREPPLPSDRRRPPRLLLLESARLEVVAALEEEAALVHVQEEAHPPPRPCEIVLRQRRS